MPPPNLDSLPIEIQLIVISNLSARKIQACRQLSHHFKRLIDCERNQAVYLKPGMTASRARIETYMAAKVSFPTDTRDEHGNPTAFINALGAFIDMQGLETVRGSRRVLLEFATTWHANRSPGNTTIDELENICIVAAVAVLLHCHYLQSTGMPHENREHLYGLWFTYQRNSLGLRTAEERAWVLAQIEQGALSQTGLTSEWSKEGSWVKPECMKQAIVKLAPSHYALDWSCSSLPWTREDTSMEGMARLTAFLGLQASPASSMYLYVKSQWAEDLIKMLHESWTPKLGLARRAAMLEDIFVARHDMYCFEDDEALGEDFKHYETGWLCNSGRCRYADEDRDWCTEGYHHFD